MMTDGWLLFKKCNIIRYEKLLSLLVILLNNKKWAMGYWITTFNSPSESWANEETSVSPFRKWESFKREGRSWTTASCVALYDQMAPSEVLMNLLGLCLGSWDRLEVEEPSPQSGAAVSTQCSPLFLPTSPHLLFPFSFSFSVFFYLCCFSVALIKHHHQGKLQKEGLIWTCGPCSTWGYDP